MKRRSRQPELVHLGSYRLSTVSAPQLQLDHLATPTMALNHFFQEPNPSPKQSNITPTKIRGRSPPHSPSPFANSQREYNIEMPGTPSALRNDTLPNTPAHSTPLGTPTSENPAWSSAIGRATTGKSGRVIERLMSENDRLLREKKLATVRLEEETKRSESARSALESLQISNENLSAMHDSDLALLAKRDRKIQEMKDELKMETARREKAEMDMRESRRERDDTVDQARKEAREDRELSKRSESQYHVLSKSWKGLEERYERQVQQLRSTIQGVNDDLERDRSKVAKLEIIIEQLRREEEKARKAKDRLMSEFDTYRLESEQSLEHIRNAARENEEANEHAQQQMLTVMGEMRHIIGVQRAFEGSKDRSLESASNATIP